jgi:hypothetical protein
MLSKSVFSVIGLFLSESLLKFLINPTATACKALSRATIENGVTEVGSTLE